MRYDEKLVASKLRYWEACLREYTLPAWEDIPDFGLYMEQIILLLNRYLDCLPPDMRADQSITAAAINNYVRQKIMPKPVKKKYYRPHIAYLVIIFSLKQSLSIPMLHTMLPIGITDDELKKIYDSYVVRHRAACEYFIEQVSLAAAGILGRKASSGLPCPSTGELIASAAVISGFSRLLAEKLLLLEGQTADVSGGGEAGDKR